MEMANIHKANHTVPQERIALLTRSPAPVRISMPSARRYPGKLAVITCYYNPSGSKRRKEIFRQFAAAAASQGADLWSLTGVLEGTNPQDPEVPGIGHNVNLPMASVLWQKERMLNILIGQLPPEYDKVAWVDGDLMFDNPHWVEDTAAALEQVPVCQLFEWVVYLSRYGVPEYGWQGPLAQPSIARHLEVGGKPIFGQCHPGFAWAARRDVIEGVGGLYDRHILGSGDSIMSIGFHAFRNHPYLQRFAGPFRSHVDTWCRRATAVTRGRVGWLPGQVRHLWHGLLVDRQYNRRALIIAATGFDPDLHIEIDTHGLWRWSSACPDSIKQMVAEYFRSRHEDGRPDGSSASVPSG